MLTRSSAPISPIPRRRSDVRGLDGSARALAGARLLREPALIEAATAELIERRGADFTYEAMVGDRAPPLDYRKSSKGD